MSDPIYVGTAQVAGALGVGVSTVKRWVDEGILPAHKTAGGHRKLLLAEVLRLARERGFPQLDLSRLSPQTALAEPPDPNTSSRDLVVALRDGKAGDAQAIIRRAYLSGLAVDALADEVIAPAMSRLGHDWETGRIDVFHEHRGTQICAEALYELKGLLEGRATVNHPVALGGASEGDFYFLSSLLAEIVLLDAGWRVVNLGPNTPLASFRAALLEVRPRLMWLSANYLPDPDRFLAEYKLFYRTAEERQVAVAVGGRALTEDLRSQMPYTTFGDRLSHLGAFANSLHPRPPFPTRGRPPKNP